MIKIKMKTGRMGLCERNFQRRVENKANLNLKAMRGLFVELDQIRVLDGGVDGKKLKHLLEFGCHTKICIR